MAVVLPGYYVFLAHARTGSTAVSKALRRWHGAEWFEENHHASLKWIFNNCKLTGKETVFTVIRNPFDVLASWWEFEGFETIIDLCQKCKNQYFLDKNNNLFYHIPHCHKVLRYESLQNGLDNLMDELQLPKVDLERVNVTKGKRHYSTYYRQEDIEFVEKHFSELNRYRYTFESE